MSTTAVLEHVTTIKTYLRPIDGTGLAAWLDGARRGSLTPDPVTGALAPLRLPMALTGVPLTCPHRYG